MARIKKKIIPLSIKYFGLKINHTLKLYTMEKDNGNFVVVRYFATETEAEIIHSLLNSYNIDSELIHTQSAGLFPMSSSEVLQIQLIANESDVPKIEAILNAKFDKEEIEKD